MTFFSIAFGQEITVKITGNIFNTTEDSVHISRFDGTKNVDHLVTKFKKGGDYAFEGKLPFADYYTLRLGSQFVFIVLKDKSEIRLNADGKNLALYNNMTGSDESVNLNEFVREMYAFNQKRDTASAMIQKNPENQKAIMESFQQEYFRFSSYRQSFIGKNTNSPALLPIVSSLDMDKDFSIYEAIMNQLMIGFPQSPSVQFANNQFQQVKVKKEASEFLASGKTVPNFSQTDKDGKEISIESLRGKVVLIDFWASWCGPCRKENPNVVKLYEQYKDKGFTVLSVSLDSDKAKWLAAIEKDKLIWPYHVSDLKGWSNAVAQQFKVQSIPFTLLIDAEGKIIDANLRGPQLEQALQNIFEKK